MPSVQHIAVTSAEADIRLDRWFARHYPALKNGQLQRLLRSKNIRVNQKKAIAAQRLAAGDEIRIPPLEAPPKSNAPQRLSQADSAWMKSLVLYQDDAVIVLNKPPGIAVQGGTKTTRHIDGLLDALRGDKDEKPRLVHRLDKETSGVLVLGRTAQAAAKLAKAFASREARKIYWAVVVGKPKLLSGKIDAPLGKGSGAAGREQVRVDSDAGQRAQTLYRVLDALGKKASWLELSPLTGRTHQIRVHAASCLNTPIVGDGKYGADRAYALGLEHNQQLHLHARAIRMPHPAQGTLEVFAPLPPYLKESFDFLGFDAGDSHDPFGYFAKE